MIDKKTYVPAYEVMDVPPLSHYYEEIIPYMQKIAAIGLRGDKNYLFYSKDGHGQSFSEISEKRDDANLTYNFFSDLFNRVNYFKRIDDIIGTVKAHIDSLSSLSLDDLTDEVLNDLLLKTYELDSLVFSYFLICQPAHTLLFEDNVKSELKKRVARDRVDTYLAQLAVSGKKTRISEEEIAWLQLVIKHKAVLSKAITHLSNLDTIYPELYSDLQAHFDEYKILSIGDGLWDYKLGYFLDQLKCDEKEPLVALKARLHSRLEQADDIERSRELLMDDLYLPNSTREVIGFLAELGFYRIKLRIEGFMPLIFANIRLLKEVGARKGFANGQDLQFLEPQELKAFLAGQYEYTKSNVKSRRGRHDEFLIHIDEGRSITYFGGAAAQKFKELVPPKDHSREVNVMGNSAMRGKAVGTVCLYNWGDSLEDKLVSIKTNKILVAGHTRPAMMPLIRASIGIVTDEGGVTSHAAIISRELRIPSVINTRYATKIFKEGDLVELDADSGIVRKI